MNEARHHGWLLLVVALAAAGATALWPRAGDAASQAQITKCVGDCDVQKHDCLNNTCAPECCLILGRFICRESCIANCYDRCIERYGGCLDACAELAGFNFDPVARLHRSGRRIRLTGPFRCEEGSYAHVSATFTELVGGRIAEGKTRERCTGEEQTFVVDAVVQRSSSGDGTRSSKLQPGKGRVCGVISIGTGSSSYDAQQWCGDVLVVDHDVELEDE